MQSIHYYMGRVHNEEVFSILRKSQEYSFDEPAPGMEKSLTLADFNNRIQGVMAAECFRQMMKCATGSVVLFLGTNHWEELDVDARRILGFGIVGEGGNVGGLGYVFRKREYWRHRLKIRHLVLINPENNTPGIPFEEFKTDFSLNRKRFWPTTNGLVEEVIAQLGGWHFSGQSGSSYQQVRDNRYPLQITTLPSAEHWSRNEFRNLVDVAMQMHQDQMNGTWIDKREIENALVPLLNNRTVGSIRMGLQNISAVLIELGLTPLEGYKPLFNHGNVIPELVDEWIETNGEYQGVVQELETSTTSPKDADADILNSLTEAPPKSERVAKPSSSHNLNGKGDYDEQGRRNRELGRKGEEWVLEYERQRLCAAGKSRLAAKIKHVADDRDGCGYDILSFNEDDESERLIEVKTTNLGPAQAFPVSSNEVEKSANESGSYFLYRVYNFRTNPRVYILKGSFEKNFDLMPIQFRAHR